MSRWASSPLIAPAGNTAPFEKCRSGGELLTTLWSNLTGPRLEPYTSRFRDERVAARPEL